MAPTDEDQDESRGEAEAVPSPERRRFLGGVALAAGALGAGLVGVPVCAVVLHPLEPREPVWFPIGEVERFPVGGTFKVTFRDPDALAWAGEATRTAAWVRREEGDRFVAFSAYCTHAGCPVRWAEGAQFFLCPCHGGVFHRDGTVAAGPPDRALPRLEVRVRGGQVEILTQPRLA